MVTNRPANYGTLPYSASPRRVTHDTVPFGSKTKELALRDDSSGVTKPDDTSPGAPERMGDSTSPGPGDSTSPGPGDSTSPGVHERDTSPGVHERDTSPGVHERDTSPGAGDTPVPFEQTSPGVLRGAVPGTDPGVREQPIQRPAAEDELDPFWRDDVDYEPPPVVRAAVRPPEATPTTAAPPPKPVAAENTENDARYKRVREIDALIARFAADVEVKVGQGRENTFLRKRSEIVPPTQGSSVEPMDRDDEFLDERTQPRHRNIEVRYEKTEIIPRRLPPRKRK
jgi:hypothetical protein